MAASYRALALLLTYPDEALQASAPEILVSLETEGLLPAPLLRALSKLTGELAGNDLYALQERYTDLFDRTRSLSLNLYEHVHGESRDRGEAMVALLELYRSRGLDLASTELPDYLPVFLEFLSTLPDDEAASLLGEAGHVLEALAERLKTRCSAYRAVFGALAHLAAGRADPEILAALLQEPDPDPDDLEALDKAWAETAVTFGPGEEGCPKAEAMVRAMGSETSAPARRGAGAAA